MPIDPRIAMQVQPMQMPNPLEQYGQVMSLKNMQQQNQMNEMAQEEARKKAEITLGVNQTIADYTDEEGNVDVGKARVALYKKYGPRAADEALTSVLTINDKIKSATKEELEIIDKKMKPFSEGIRNIMTLPPENQEAAYQSMLSTMDIPADMKAKIPLHFDPVTMGMYYNTNELIKSRLEARKAELDVTAAERTMPDKDTGLNPFQQAQINKTNTDKDKQSLNEELADLYTITNPSESEKNRKQAIEKALGYVANQYGSGWKLLNTPEGNPLWYQPSTGKTEYAPEGTRKEITSEERKDISLLDEMMGQSKELKGLADKNRDVIGWGVGWATEVKNKISGTTPDISKLIRISNNLKDVLLRARSGAQINETEYKRLERLMPSVNTSEVKFFSDLNAFMEETQRLIDRRSGKTPLVSPSGPQPAIKPKSDPLGLF